APCLTSVPGSLRSLESGSGRDVLEIIYERATRCRNYRTKKGQRYDDLRTVVAVVSHKNARDFRFGAINDRLVDPRVRFAQILRKPRAMHQATGRNCRTRPRIWLGRYHRKVLAGGGSVNRISINRQVRLGPPSEFTID